MAQGGGGAGDTFVYYIQLVLPGVQILNVRTKVSKCAAEEAHVEVRWCKEFGKQGVTRYLCHMAL